LRNLKNSTFLRRNAAIWTAILPVRLSMSVTRVLRDETEERTADILITHERVITLVFLYQQTLVGGVSFRLNFALMVTDTLTM